MSDVSRPSAGAPSFKNAIIKLMSNVWLKNGIFYFVCFLAPVCMLCFVSIVCDVYPFGSQSFLTEDLKYQYIDFFQWFKGVLAGTNSLFYSASQALGSNAWGLYSYYLGSPWNLIIAFVSNEQLPIAIYCIVALKLGLIQVSATWYVRKRFGIKCSWAFILAFGYTWCTWVVTNLRNPLWLDSLYLLPLMMYGVYRLLRFGQIRWVVVPLALSVICCWYTAYSSILFCCLVFLFEYFIWTDKPTEYKGFFFRRIAALCSSFVLALLLSAWTFVPTLFAMSGSSDRTSVFAIISNILNAGSPIAALRAAMTSHVKDILKSFVCGGWTLNSCPQLYCGALLGLGVLFFFFSRRVTGRQKIFGLLLLLTIFASIMLSPLEAIWCGFRSPNGFYSRVSMYVAPTLLLLVSLWVSQQKASHERAVKPARLNWARCFDWLSASRVLRSVVALLVVVDLCINSLMIFPQLYCDYAQKDYDSYRESSAKLLNRVATDVSAEAQGADGSTGLSSYRFAKSYTRAGLAALNEGMATGYNELSSYSSAHNSAAVKFLESLGYSKEGEFSVRFAHPVPLSDSLLSVRYIAANHDEPGYSLLSNPDETPDGLLLKNESSLSLGYVVPASMEEVVFDDDANPFENQNALMSAVLGREVELFQKCNIKTVKSLEGGLTLEYEVDVPAGCVGYVSVAGSSQSMNLSIDGLSTELENWRFQCAIESLGDEQSEPTTHSIILSSVSDEPLSFDSTKSWFYSIDLDVLNECLNDLRSGQLQIDEYRDGYLRGTVVADSESADILLSIPCDSGWTVSVNGEKVQAQQAYDGALMLIPLQEGENAIEMSYVSPGFYHGVGISLLSLIGIAIWLFVHHCIYVGRVRSVENHG